MKKKKSNSDSNASTLNIVEAIINERKQVVDNRAMLLFVTVPCYRQFIVHIVFLVSAFAFYLLQ